MKLVVVCWLVGFLSIISDPTENPALVLYIPNVTDHHFCDSAPLLESGPAP